MRLEALQARVRAATERVESLVIASRRLCRPVAYAAIAIGAVWTASSAPTIFGGPEVTPDAGGLRIASSILVGGLLLAALAHWDESGEGEPIDPSGDP